MTGSAHVSTEAKKSKCLLKERKRSDVLNRLSRDLTEHYGKGFSHSNLIYMRKLFLSYQKRQTLSDVLSWSHYIELLKIDDPPERSFYEKETIEAHWGVRELKRRKIRCCFTVLP